MSVLSAPYMHNEVAAFTHVEAMLWVDGPVYPHCGAIDRAYKLEGVRTKPSKKNLAGKERFGLGIAVVSSQCAKAQSLRQATYRFTCGCKQFT